MKTTLITLVAYLGFVVVILCVVAGFFRNEIATQTEEDAEAEAAKAEEEKTRIYGKIR